MSELGRKAKPSISCRWLLLTDPTLHLVELTGGLPQVASVGKGAAASLTLLSASGFGADGPQGHAVPKGISSLTFSDKEDSAYANAST